MVVDSSRIRRKSMRDCKRARTTFEKAERELEAYETRDKPAFVRWYRASLGPRIGEVKSLTNQVRNLYMTMERVKRFSDLTGCGRYRAARLHEDSPEAFERQERACLDRVQREEERRHRKFAEKREAEARNMRCAFGDFLESQVGSIRKLRETGISPFGIFFEVLTFFCDEYGFYAPEVTIALDHPDGVALLDRYDLTAEFDLDDEDLFEDEFDDDNDAFSDIFGAPRPSVGKEHDQARLAFLRRQLAFALHPDQSDSDTDPSKMELWHQVQEAVENRDLDRLEVLHAHCQMLCGDLSLQTPVSRLQALTDMYRRSRDALRRRIRTLRKEPDWEFGTLDETGRKNIRRQLERRLNEQTEQLRADLAMAQEIYRRNFVRPSVRKMRSATPVREPQDAPGQSQFDFL